MSEEKAAASRRDFLKLASVTAPAAAVVAGSGGYRKTEHVEKYLDSARF